LAKKALIEGLPGNLQLAIKNLNKLGVDASSVCIAVFSSVTVPDSFSRLF
jgi:hypothetical protein